MSPVKMVISALVKVHLLFILSASVVLIVFGCDQPDGYLAGKESFCSSSVLSEKMFCYVFSFPPGVYVGTLNPIALTRGPSILNCLFL